MSLVIRIKDFNKVLLDSILLKKLKSLTLYGINGYSGMTYEIDNLHKLSQLRRVKARALIAEKDEKIVGWALLSREKSKYMNRFSNKDWFNPEQHGSLCEIYILPEYRRQGIGTELVKVARRKSNPYPLAFVPWDYTSIKFYDKFSHYNHYKL